MSEKREEGLTVVAAAIRSGNMIFTMRKPARHHHILQSMSQDFGMDAIKIGTPDDQGFLLSDGRFATRRQAARIAVQAEQILEPKYGRDLYSEDLW